MIIKVAWRTTYPPAVSDAPRRGTMGSLTDVRAMRPGTWLGGRSTRRHQARRSGDSTLPARAARRYNFRFSDLKNPPRGPLHPRQSCRRGSEKEAEREARRWPCVSVDRWHDIDAAAHRGSVMEVVPVISRPRRGPDPEARGAATIRATTIAIVLICIAPSFRPELGAGAVLAM